MYLERAVLHRRMEKSVRIIESKQFIPIKIPTITARC